MVWKPKSQKVKTVTGTLRNKKERKGKKKRNSERSLVVNTLKT